MASEAISGNMHMDTSVIKVADFKFEVIYSIGFLSHTQLHAYLSWPLSPQVYRAIALLFCLISLADIEEQF